MSSVQDSPEGSVSVLAISTRSQAASMGFFAPACTSIVPERCAGGRVSDGGMPG